MTSRTLPDCTGCRHPGECNARGMAGIHNPGERSSPCAPVIDAEKSNEAVQIVSLIRKRTGGSHLIAFTAE